MRAHACACARIERTLLRVEPGFLSSVAPRRLVTDAGSSAKVGSRARTSRDEHGIGADVAIKIVGLSNARAAQQFRHEAGAR
jgi:hypothetical protein